MEHSEKTSEKDVREKGVPPIQKLQNLELLLQLEKSACGFAELYDSGR